MTDQSIHVCHLLGSLGSGGRESLLIDIIENTPESIRYSLYCFKSDEEMVANFEALGTSVESFGICSTSDVSGFSRLYLSLLRSDIDILHLHGPRAQVPGRVLGRLSGIPSIVGTHHGVREMFPENVLRYERVTRRLESVTIAVSEGVRRSFVGNTDTGQWKTIHNGIDVQAFQASVQAADGDRVRKRHGLDDELVFLNVGRYVPPKAQHDLITAMHTAIDDLPPSHLFIVGGRGAMEDRLRAAVRKRDLEGHVSVTGHVDDIKAYYAAADAFVSSSVKEGLPIVLLEAMAAQLPVIATSIPGVRELIVDRESGILVPPEEPQQLGNQIIKMSDAQTRERYGQAGYLRVLNHFDISNTIDGYLSVYQESARKRDI